MAWAEEQAQIKAGVGPFLDRRQRERQAYVARQAFPTRGDKAVRAQSIRGRMALEGLYLPTNKSWVEPLRSELLSFPAGKHDDQADALGLIGQLLDQMMPGERPRPQTPIKRPLRQQLRVQRTGRGDEPEGALVPITVLLGSKLNACRCHFLAFKFTSPPCRPCTHCV